MTTQPPITFERAMAQSAVGHVVVFGIAALCLIVSQLAQPKKPDEILMDVSLMLGPPTKGEFGSPSPDALTDQDKNETGAAKIAEPPPPPPPKDVPPIRDVPVPQPPKLEEPKVADIPVKKETPQVKPPDIKPAPPKPPDAAQNKTPTNSVAQPPKKHEVKISKEIVSVSQPTKTTPTKLGPARTTLTQQQLQQQLGLGLPKSDGGGSGFRGGEAPGSIERGALGSAMELYKSALKAKLYNAWVRPAGVDGLRTVIKLSIARNGAVISARMVKGSGSPQMDTSAMNAVQSVSPSPLPSGVDAPYQIDVEFDASGVSV